MNLRSSFLFSFTRLLIFVVLSCAQIPCDLYIAESTIPHAGYGVFTSVEKFAGDEVGNGDIAFPLVELTQHLGEEFDDPFQDYVWDGKTMGMGFESATGEVTALWPGLDCTVNSLIPLENVHRAFPQHLSHGDHLPYMPHRSKDPAAGSVSPYRSGTTRVMRNIPIGGELFKSYGDEWFISRPQYFDKGFPITTSFLEAQDLLERYRTFNFPPLFDLLRSLQKIWVASSRTLNALPSDSDDLRLALEHDINEIYQKNATRSLDWLQEHGTCVDHILHKRSTISGIGEGAFAKRTIPNGTVITGSPLIVVSDTFFDMVQSNDDDAPYTRQILYNYCFGHVESSLLLFPYAAVGALYINHAEKNRSNVRIQWAPPDHLRHDPSLLQLSPAALYEEVFSPQLGIEFVATKDIAEGEELFLDYGMEWTTRWQHHVDNWKPHERETTAFDENLKKSEILTAEEQIANPYPKSVEIRCNVRLLEDEVEWSKEWKRYGYYPPDEYVDVYGLPCEILSRSENNSTYTVALSTDNFTFQEVPWENFRKPLRSDAEYWTRSGIPREAIFFLDGIYESDLYIRDAFRFPMQLPDDMMPEVWKDRPKLSENRNDEL